MNRLKGFTPTPNDGIVGRSILTLFTPKKKRHLVWGFTLIETLIYIGIFSIVALSLSGILWNTLQINSNQQAANEVDENLRYVMSVLNEKVRASTAIIATTTPGVLVLKGSVYQDVYNIFSVVDGVLYFQEGAGTPVAVTSNQVLVDSLIFTRIEMAGAKDGVSVDITLSYNSDKPELAFSKNLISTVNRVSAITFDSDILPDVDDSRSVGDINQSWKNGYFSGNLSIEGNETLTGDLTVDTDTLYVNSASNYVGIGTTTPAYSLHIYRSNSSPVVALSYPGYAVAYVSAGLYGNFGTINDSDVSLRASSTIRMVIDSTTGYVGVATTTPTEVLEVNGNIRLSGGTATYKIKNVATPTDSSDVATKGYVDAAGTTYTQYMAFYTPAGTYTWTNPNGAASTTVSVIVVGGGGGGGGASNNGANGVAGSAGGTSSFGSLASATGGAGGGLGPNYAVAADGGAGHHQGGTGIPGGNTYEPGGSAAPGGIGLFGCGSGGHGAGGERGTGGGGGSGYTAAYYGVTAASSITVTVGAGGAGGASSGLSSPPGGTDGSKGCVIVYWWDN